MTFSLFTTFSKFQGPFLTFRPEREVLGFTARRTTNDKQARPLQRPQTMADMALLAGQGTHHLLGTARCPPPYIGDPPPTP
jgi:hypothetical protein